MTLTGQQANTEVSVSVTTFSLWSNSRMSVSGSFTSLPDSKSDNLMISLLACGGGNGGGGGGGGGWGGGQLVVVIPVIIS